MLLKDRQVGVLRHQLPNSSSQETGNVEKDQFSPLLMEHLAN